MKQNDIHPPTHTPNVLLKIYLKKQSQPEINTVVIFILLCTGWVTALRYQMIAFSVFPGVDSGDSKHQWSTVGAQASDTQPKWGPVSHLQGWRHLSHALSSVNFSFYCKSQQIHFETIHHRRHVNCVGWGGGGEWPTLCTKHALFLSLMTEDALQSI